MSANIISAYQQYLGRTPSQDEITYWAGRNLDSATLANNFVSSPEYQQRMGDQSRAFVYQPSTTGGAPQLVNNNSWNGTWTAAQPIQQAPQTAPKTTTPAQPAFDVQPLLDRINGLQSSFEQYANRPQQNVGGLGGLGGMQQAQPQQFDPTPYFNAFQQQQQSFMDKWGEMAGFNKPTSGVGSGQWGNYGGNTSPVYRPNQGGEQPRNGWGGPWGSRNPFSPTV